MSGVESVIETLAKTLHSASSGYSFHKPWPCGSAACSNAHREQARDLLTPLIDQARREAWDEGWNQGTGDAWQNGGHRSKPNPYGDRAAAS